MPTLDWIGKDKVVNHHMDVPYRVLEKKYSYGEDSDNMIIHGDNLSALKSLLPQYEGRIKCIYIVIWSRKHTQRIQSRFDRQCNFTDLRIPVKVKVHVSRPLTGILKSA